MVLRISFEAVTGLRNIRTPAACPCIMGSDWSVAFGYGTSWGQADGLPSLNLISSEGIEDKNGTLWIALADAGLVRIENRKIVKVYTERDGLPGSPLSFVTGRNHQSSV